MRTKLNQLKQRLSEFQRISSFRDTFFVYGNWEWMIESRTRPSKLPSSKSINTLNYYTLQIGLREVEQDSAIAGRSALRALKEAGIDALQKEKGEDDTHYSYLQLGPDPYFFSRFYVDDPYTDPEVGKGIRETYPDRKEFNAKVEEIFLGLGFQKL